jgi:UPF0755 protein
VTGYQDDYSAGDPDRRLRTSGPGDRLPASVQDGQDEGGETRYTETGHPHGEPAGYGEAGYGEAGYGEAEHLEAEGYDELEAEDYDDLGFEDYDDFGFEDYDDFGFEGRDGGAEHEAGRGGAHRQRGAASPGPSRRGPGGGGRRRSEYRRRRILAGLAVVVVLVVLAGLGGVIYARRQINPGGRPGPMVTVRIPQGSSSSEIGKILAAVGVIHDGGLFPYYVKLTNNADLLPGQYRLAKNESYSNVVNALQRGPVLIVDKLTIPEGFTLAQIAARVAALPGLHLSAAKFLAAGTSGEVRSTYEPKGVNDLEGLVFPATYDVRQGQEEADILQEMVNTFDLRVGSLGLPAAATKLHLTPYQVVTVASIVEREAKLEADRGDVASTLYNRLAKGMALGADSTQTYYLRLTDPTLQPTVAQLNTPSPYNTRTQTGLPPTPIANPGIPSLQAAIDPPTTDDLYFVEINSTGKLGFATDTAGFAQLQAQCQAARLC